MNDYPFTTDGNGCDAIQRQISNAADSGETLPADVQTHLDGCADCAGFAAQWLHGPPTALAEKPVLAAASGVPLRERILDQLGGTTSVSSAFLESASSAKAADDTEVVPPGREFHDSESRRNVVPFPPPSRRGPSWSAWAGRIAAALALAAFSYWLLDPKVTPAGGTARPSAGNAGPTLGQGLTKMEDRSRAERAAIAKAVAGGGQQVHQSLHWSVSALEL